jgi:hypothetical protein
MKCFVGVVALFLSGSVCAQSSLQPGKLSISLCPLAAVDVFSFPTIQAGVEYGFSQRFSLYNEFGVEYIRSFVGLADTSFVRPHGIKVKTELRYYFGDSHYLALNGFLTRDTHNTELVYFDNHDTAMERTDAFGVKKLVWGWNVVYGVEESWSRHFGVDLYVGCGVRLREIHTVGEQFVASRDYLVHSTDVNAADMRATVDSKAGFSVTGNLTAGVRVFYRL